MFDALDAGDVEAALNRYTGPLLTQSVSPAVARLRTQLSATLREAVSWILEQKAARPGP